MDKQSFFSQQPHPTQQLSPLLRPARRAGVAASVSALTDPAAFAFGMLCGALLLQGRVGLPAVLLAALVFVCNLPGRSRLEDRLPALFSAIIWRWLLNVAALAALVRLFGVAGLFDHPHLALALALPPLFAVLGQMLLRLVLPPLRARFAQEAIFIGLTAHGEVLARYLACSPSAACRVLGFFDDRPSARTAHSGLPRLGKMADVAQYVREHHVGHIYITLAMSSQPRILQLLDALRDTTASIHFVPDVFVTDLIQGRIETVGGMPVIAVCDSPFVGWNALLKRGSDLVLASLILALISVPMLLIALGVRLSSPGPVIFRQRRYGLDGHEIVVYKFRSMTVCEDGGQIRQASRNDQRVTPFGAFLRRTSLDELPQFINVLQGRMSIVGPRPHAIAHNEAYRKLIKGYMVRHKVRPGITGLAQVSGCRGETDTLDKMRRRIEYDLDYLRHWSLLLDIKIILRTVLTVLGGDKQAY